MKQEVILDVTALSNYTFSVTLYYLATAELMNNPVTMPGP